MSRLHGKTGRLSPGSRRRGQKHGPRRGVSALDYMLILVGVVLPIVIFLLPIGSSPGVGSRIIRVVYEMVCGLIAWPLM